MPLIPRGLTQRLFNRVVDRTRQELGRPLERGKSFFDRVKERTLTELGLPGRTQVPVARDPWAEAWEPAPEPTQSPEIPPQGPATTEDEIRARISAAGRRLLLIRMKYHGLPRDVEPYKIADGRGKDGNDLFYGWCYKDKALESFRMDRIEDVQITNRPFVPRNNWPVEF